jgi:hypothetical protein
MKDGLTIRDLFPTTIRCINEIAVADFENFEYEMINADAPVATTNIDSGPRNVVQGPKN